MADEETEELTRISFSMDQTTKRNIRIASAVAGKEPGEWAVDILDKASTAAVKEAKLG